MRSVTGRLQNLPGLPSALAGDFQHLRRKAGAIRDVLHGVSLANQVTRLVEGPTTTGVNPGYDHLAGLSALLRPA
jgi:hypothetical protein